MTLARAGAVTVESRTPEEIVVRVRSPGRIVAPTAVLYPTENETECDCPSRDEPVRARRGGGDRAVGRREDAAAGAGAGGDARTARAWASSVRRQSSRGRRFRASAIGSTRVDDGLRLARVLVAADGGETALATELTAVLADPARAAQLAGRGGGPARPIGCWARARRRGAGALQPTKLDALMGILVGAPRVWLDGVAIGISEEEVRPVATLRMPDPSP